MKQKYKKIQKLITFPEPMYSRISAKAEERGLLFPEYVRHVLLNDIEDTTMYPFVDEQTEESIGKSLDDYANGRYVSFHSPEEVEKYFNQLTDEAEDQ